MLNVKEHNEHSIGKKDIVFDYWCTINCYIGIDHSSVHMYVETVRECQLSGFECSIYPVLYSCYMNWTGA